LAALSRDAQSSVIVRNVMTLGIAQLVTWASSAVLIVLMPPYLGDADLGRLSFALTLSALLVLGTDLGASPYLTREVARSESAEHASNEIINALIMRLPFIAGAMVVTFVGVNLASVEPESKRVVYVLLPAMALQTFNVILVAALTGFQDMRPVARADVVGKVAMSVSIGLIVFTDLGLIAIAVVHTLPPLLGVIWTGYALRKHIVSFTVKLSRFITQFRLLMPFFIWQASLAIYVQIDIVMLSIMTEAAVVGWYAAAWRLFLLPSFLPGILSRVLYPAMAGTFKDAPQAFASLTRRGLRAVLVFLLPLSLGLALLPDKIVDFLGYPDSFDSMVPLLAILAVTLPLVGADVIIGTALVASDRQRQWSLVALASAILNPAMNFVLIPETQSAFDNGAIGAAAATLATEVFVFACGLRLIAPNVLGREDAEFCWRWILTGLAMAVVTWLLRDLGIVVAGSLGLLAYVGAVFLLRTVSIEEIRDLIRRRSLSQPVVPVPDQPISS
jgi:O-antigen/teichoic acid export membrane protein